MMFETGDSYETIGLGQSALSEQSSSEESSDWSSSDRHSASEQDSEHSTMSSSTDPVKTSQLNEFEFELAWKTRRAIISHLDQHTKLLSGLTIKPEARQKLRTANGDLMLGLLNLPVKVDGHSKRFKSLRRSPNGSRASAVNQLVLDLSWEMRSRIVDTLITNHQIVQLDADHIASQLKSTLIDENNNLICELVKLRSRAVAKEDHRIDQTSKLQPGQTASSPMLEEFVTVLREELEKLKILIAGESSKPINDLSSVNVSLEEDRRGAENKHDQWESVLENEITITFELRDIEILLAAAGSKKNSRRKLFYCSGIPFFLRVRPWAKDGVKYVGVYLHPSLVDQERWSVVASFEFRLLSSDAAGGDVLQIRKDQAFENYDSIGGRGWSGFITVEKLRAGSFIQNDTIKIQVHVTVKSFERIAD